MKLKRIAIVALSGAIAAALSAGAAPQRGSPERETAESLQAAFMKVAEKVGPAVVGVYNIQRARIQGYIRPRRGYFDFNDLWGKFLEIPLERRSLGSGIIIGEDGYILTNEHVVGNADEIEVTLADGRSFKGEVAGKDRRADLAVIKIDANDLPVATLGDSDSVKTGQWAIAIGNPFLIFEDNPKPTVTVGVVSALHRKLGASNLRGRYYSDLIQTDAAINMGNSGGPLLDLAGEVIGINAAIISPSGANSGIGFAIPINRAKEILGDLRAGRKIEYGWLGVGIQAPEGDLAEKYGVPDQAGALVVTVVEGSPAAAAGMQAGDVIREFKGREIKDPDDLMEEVGRTKAGSMVKIKIIRDGVEKELDVAVGKKGERVA